jgi:pilus assembly protein CpaE
MVNDMKKTLNILISGRDRVELDTLSAVIGEVAAYHMDLLHVTNGHVDPLHGVTTMPDVLLLCLSANWKDELQALSDRPPAGRPPVLVIAPEGDPQVMRRAMQAGARDYFTRPVGSSDLLRSLKQLEQDHATTQPGQGGLTVVMNAKGGSGASMIATNLACAMAIEARQNTVLVDMDIQFGNLGMYLDLVPERGLLDAIDAADEIDSMALQAYTLTHKSGVEVLANTHHQIALPGEINVTRLNRLLDILQGTYDQVVVDLPRQIDLLTTTVLERASRVVLCMQQSLNHVQDASRLSSILQDELGLTRGQVIIAINRYDLKSPVSLADIGHHLPGLRQMTVPNDFKRVSDNVDLGVPLYEQAPKAPITRAISSLMQEICGCQTMTTKGLFSRMLGSLHTA